MYLKHQSRLLAVVISSSLLCTILYWNKALALVVRTNQHRLHYVIAESHDQLAFLSDTRVSGTELYFWSGLGTTNEKIYFLATEDSIQKYKPIFEERGLTFTEAYNTVKITYIEDNPDHPNKAEVSTLSEQDVGSSENEDGDDDDSEEVDVGANLEDVAAEMKDEEEIELLILQRLNRIKENSGNIEVIAPAPLSTGLLEVKKMVGITDGESLPMHQGLLYRIQGVQTLDVGNSTSEEDGEWTYGGSGLIPLVGEFLGVSFKWERDGVNPYITAEEAKYWKNDEYLQNKTKSVLWMFVPTEHEKFYEIRNRNYPMSLLVWMYDKEEGEFVLGMETRRNYMRRYQAEGDLRNRALFSLEMISETYKWELRHNRPKFYLITFNQNHVYLFESARKRCSILVVRNSATDPYNPAKTEKIGRPLDMFYITRTNLTGKFTANIHSFLYDKTIVDVFADSAMKGWVRQISEFDMFNRAPISTTQYVYEEISQNNSFTFNFRESLSAFQWVTIESHIPSFGVAPMIHTGVMKDTDVKQISKEVEKKYKIQDRVMLSSGEAINASTIFQYAEEYDNPFSALMEVSEPADRLMWDRSGKPKFVRLSLPGSLIEHNWKEKAKFKYERIIESREVALVVQVRGKMKGKYGLRGFVKKGQMPFGQLMEVCEED